MKTNIQASTNGRGHWTDEERSVTITELRIGYKSTDYFPEEEFAGELRALFDPCGFTPGSWHVGAYGLIYTDKQWLREFKQGLRVLGFSRRAVQDISYSEQGMQSGNYVSMDVGPVFYASWCRLQKKLSSQLCAGEQEKALP